MLKSALKTKLSKSLIRIFPGVLLTVLIKKKCTLSDEWIILWSIWNIERQKLLKLDERLFNQKESDKRSFIPFMKCKLNVSVGKSKGYNEFAFGKKTTDNFDRTWEKWVREGWHAINCAANWEMGWVRFCGSQVQYPTTAGICPVFVPNLPSMYWSNWPTNWINAARQDWKRENRRRKKPFLKKFFLLASGFCIIDCR